MQIARGMTLAGRYEVEQRLGSGSMGIVWQAHDTRLDRQVAVKLAVDGVSSDPDAGEAHRRLRHEAIAIGAVTEPRIARVYDFLEAGDDAFIVMELVQGESLATRLDRERRLSVDEALRVTMQCAQALEAAHRAGVVHRDVKPSNIMLAEDGVKVVDFGIAATADRSLSSSSGSWNLVGTAAYISPERAMGAPASPPADFYALGVVLYQMLSGHLPYSAEEPLSILYAHVTAQPLPLPEFIPAPLAGLCMRLLDKNPYARPTSVEAVKTALESAATELPAPRTTPIAPAAAHEAGRRRAGRIVLGKPLAAVLLGGAALIAATAWVTLDVAGSSTVAGIGPAQSSRPSASAAAHASGTTGRPGDSSSQGSSSNRGTAPAAGASSNGGGSSAIGSPSAVGPSSAPTAPTSSGGASESAPGIPPSIVGGPQSSASTSASASASACKTRGNGKCKSDATAS